MTLGPVYLGGPIGGFTWQEADGWRVTAAKYLDPIVTLSPMRNFNGVSQLICNPHFNEHVNDPQILPFENFFKRDYEDVDSSSLLLFNFLGARRKSIGSTCEIARGFAKQIPIVLVMEPGNINEDIFLLAHVQPSLRFDNLYNALKLIKQCFKQG